MLDVVETGTLRQINDLTHTHTGHAVVATQAASDGCRPPSPRPQAGLRTLVHQSRMEQVAIMANRWFNVNFDATIWALNRDQWYKFCAIWLAQWRCRGILSLSDGRPFL
eukprot:5051205-Amphidinium_carterae.2